MKYVLPLQFLHPLTAAFNFCSFGGPVCVVKTRVLSTGRDLQLRRTSQCLLLYNLASGTGFRIEATRGMQQGDLIGPVLFALAIHPVILGLQKHKLDLQSWYHDDRSLCGQVEQLQAAFAGLAAEFEKIGLPVRDDKCRLFFPRDMVVDNFITAELLPCNEGIKLLSVAMPLCGLHCKKNSRSSRLSSIASSSSMTHWLSSYF